MVQSTKLKGTWCHFIELLSNYVDSCCYKNAIKYDLKEYEYLKTRLCIEDYGNEAKLALTNRDYLKTK